MAEPYVELDHALKSLTEVIAATRRVVSEGTMVSLDPLQDEVERICTGLQALAPAEAMKARAPLLALMAGLDDLAGEMATQRDKAASGLKTTAHHGHAASAYARKGRRADRGKGEA